MYIILVYSCNTIALAEFEYCEKLLKMNKFGVLVFVQQYTLKIFLMETELLLLFAMRSMDFFMRDQSSVTTYTDVCTCNSYFRIISNV